VRDVAARLRTRLRQDADERTAERLALGGRALACAVEEQVERQGDREARDEKADDGLAVIDRGERAGEALERGEALGA
jgi:hypothetical protein